jgi:hypothetical protein
MSTRENESPIHRASKVPENPPADPSVAINHFRSKLSFETDPLRRLPRHPKRHLWNCSGRCKNPESYTRGHVPGSINVPPRSIDSTSTASRPRDKVIVTYCDGVFCNASTKAAAKLTALGFRVKEMLDGMERMEKGRISSRRDGHANDCSHLPVDRISMAHRHLSDERRA